MALPVDEIDLSDRSMFKVKAGRHIVFFLRDDKTIFVVRILHERMDLAQHLE